MRLLNTPLCGLIAVLMTMSPASAQGTAGCPAPAAGKLTKPVKVDRKARGKFSVDAAPRIATLTPATICDTAAKMRSGGAIPVSGAAAALGLSSQVLNTASGRLDLFAMPSVEAELQKALAGFTRAWPYATIGRPPRILFRASDAYDAYALPDNSIVMSMGVLEAAESDSEVLFVLAHEYAHILMGHHLRAENISSSKGLVGAVSTIYTAGTVVSQLRSGRTAAALNTAQVGAESKKASVLAEALRFAVDDLFTTNWPREQEDEADALAMDLLIGSNSTIDSYANVFARLEKMMVTQSASRAKRSTAAQGIEKNLAATMKQLASPEMLGNLAGGNNSGLKSMAGKLALGIGASAIAGAASGQRDTHLPPDERRKGLAAYFQAGYPTAEPPIDNGVMVKRYKAIAEFKKAVATKATYLKARNAYFSEDFGGAMTGLKLIGAGTRTAPTFVNFMAALVARDSGNAAQAAQYYEAGRTGTGIPSVQLFESYAEAKIAQNDMPTSRRVLDDAEARFRDLDHFRSIEIARYVAGGETAQAQSQYDACVAIKGRDYIPARCKAAFPQAEAAAAEKKPRFKLPGGLPNPF